ncbi:MAG: hypothetical protein AAFQ98_22615 [Bacteroidota bacterium]
MEEKVGNLKARKYALIEQIMQWDEAKVSRAESWFSNLESQTLEEYNQDLDKALNRRKQGKSISHDEAIARIQSWR